MTPSAWIEFFQESSETKHSGSVRAFFISTVSRFLGRLQRRRDTFPKVASKFPILTNVSRRLNPHYRPRTSTRRSSSTRQLVELLCVLQSALCFFPTYKLHEISSQPFEPWILSVNCSRSPSRRQCYADILRCGTANRQLKPLNGIIAKAYSRKYELSFARFEGQESSSTSSPG